jgi:acyl-CoA hydrolase
MTTLDTNLLGTVHGGVIMKLVDDVAGAVAQRHSGGPAVTASMDEMAFLEPVHVGDLVRRRFAEAEIRRTHRLARRAAILQSRGES